VLERPETSLPVRQFEAWHRLYSLLLVEPGAAQVGASPQLSTLIRPTLDIFSLLETPEFDTTTVVLTGTAGGFMTGFQVPEDSRVIVTSAWLDATVGSCALAVNDGGAIDVPLTPRQTAEKLWTGRIVLDRSHGLGAIRDGDANDTGVLMTFVFQRIVCYR